MHAVVRHVGIALSADFRPGQPFPSSTTRSYTFGNNCWAVILHYSIRIVDAVHLWEATGQVIGYRSQHVYCCYIL